MPEPRSAEEWAVLLEDWATLPSGVSPQMVAEMVCAYAQQQVREALEEAEKRLLSKPAGAKALWVASDAVTALREGRRDP